MITHIWILIKKDIQLMMSGKIFIMSIGTLILFSIYINFMHSDMDVSLPKIALYDPLEKVQENNSVIIVNSRDELMNHIKSGKIGIGIDYNNEVPQIIQFNINKKTNNLYAEYALSLIANKNTSVINNVTNKNLEMKNRGEFTNVFLFFEIVTMGLLAVASLIFKEKQMGTIRLFTTLPTKRNLFIVSKCLVFLLSDIVFTVLLVAINIEISSFFKTIIYLLPHIIILSIIMGLVGLIFSFLYNDFRQFSLIFVFIFIIITMPVYLYDNELINWEWITLYPIYNVFVAMKDALFGVMTTNISYYLICLITIIGLFVLASKKLYKELGRG